jgi:hypothetical protein
MMARSKNSSAGEAIQEPGRTGSHSNLRRFTMSSTTRRQRKSGQISFGNLSSWRLSSLEVNDHPRRQWCWA